MDSRTERNDKEFDLSLLKNLTYLIDFIRRERFVFHRYGKARYPFIWWLPSGKDSPYSATITTTIGSILEGLYF